MLTLLLVLLFLYLAMVFLAHRYARKIIFQPPSPSYPDKPPFFHLNAENGERIAALYLPHPNARFTLLVSHGNAEDLGYMQPYLEQLRACGFSVLAYDYRGYGNSTGIPSEKNACQDAETAYRYLTQALQVPAQRILARGFSLGGGVAAALASKHPVGGLILESTFVSAYRVATRIPLLPLDKFRTLSRVRRLRCPVLVMHGKRDTLIPFWHGELLWQQAPEPKQHLWIDDAGHNDFHI